MTMREVKSLLYTLQEVKASRNSQPVQILAAEVAYHEAAGEYWDNQVGSSLKYSDDYCTNKWEYHQAKRDKAWNSLKHLEEEADL